MYKGILASSQYWASWNQGGNEIWLTKVDNGNYYDYDDDQDHYGRDYYGVAENNVRHLNQFANNCFPEQMEWAQLLAITFAANNKQSTSMKSKQ